MSMTCTPAPCLPPTFLQAVRDAFARVSTLGTSPSSTPMPASSQSGGAQAPPNNNSSHPRDSQGRDLPWSPTTMQAPVPGSLYGGMSSVFDGKLLSLLRWLARMRAQGHLLLPPEWRSYTQVRGVGWGGQPVIGLGGGGAGFIIPQGIQP